MKESDLNTIIVNSFKANNYYAYKSGYVRFYDKVAGPSSWSGWSDYQRVKKREYGCYELIGPLVNGGRGTIASIL